MNSTLKADLVLHSGTIWTMAVGQKLPYDSIAIRKGGIIAAGSRSSLDALIGPQTNQISLEGRTVLPGFCDSHIHLQEYAQSLNLVDCETETIGAALERIAAARDILQKDAWIRGHGWRSDRWERTGNSSDLDRITGIRPAFITSKSLHAAWVNSRALEIAGINNATPDPAGGEIVRDGSGFPTGILLENAIKLILPHLPQPTPYELAAMLKTAQTNLHKLGITSVHDFDGALCFSALQILHFEKRLKLRVLKQVRSDALEAATEAGLRSNFGNPWLRIGQVKFFADGALGPRTALMLEPYEGSGDEYGIAAVDFEALFTQVHQCVESGFAVSIHAIGDAANRRILELLERLDRQALQKPALPHRIEHFQLVHPDDLYRIKRDDLVISMQPFHAISDMTMAEKHWGTRCKYAYAWRSVLDKGAALIFGSDSPVELPIPLWGIHAAVSRRDHNGSPEQGWNPDECITRKEAVLAYTRTPAFASGSSAFLGQLAPGYLADLQVYSEDPLHCELDDLLHLKPCAVMVDGSWTLRDF
ncbi:MAG: amidohydrolase [Anaerolineales bacterium]|nr:amidohydrolase [Anaerolineales bacterium]